MARKSLGGSNKDTLPTDCKMRDQSRYASDLDCKACGLGECDVCDQFEAVSAAHRAALRAATPEPVAPAPRGELGEPQKPFSETFSAMTAIKKEFRVPAEMEAIALSAAEAAWEVVPWLTNCCNCGRVIDKREQADGGDKFGAELSDGRWTCSFECYSAVVPDPTPTPPSTDIPRQAPRLTKREENGQ